MSAEEEASALEARLGAKLPPSIAALPAEELSDLLGAIRDARRRQAAELQVAGEKALGLMPRLLRGPVRKIAGAG